MERPSSRTFPWYDSWWLERYARARQILGARRPEALDRFDETFAPFHTRLDFRTQRLSDVLDEQTLAEARHAARRLQPSDLELHEIRRFGRFVVHDHPFFTDLQQRLLPLVRELVREEIAPVYNFLSLYTARGVCPPHLDAPSAKWTLDLCLAQSHAWPIHVSQVVPWPGWPLDDPPDANWERTIVNSPALRFESHALEPGDALLFSGSSQWHYRDPFPAREGYCHLVFFHYAPPGARAVLDPRTWADRFGLSELCNME